jgi:predicted dehydrogenase
MINLVVAGTGNRAKVYARYCQENPDRVRIIAVAEPVPEVRAAFAEANNIAPENCYEDWRDLFAQGKIGDAALITTTDMLHTAPALAALDLGYDVLLEKPMAPNLAENMRLVHAAEAAGRLLQICHVLRYTTFFGKVREIVQSGRLGRIINVTHSENLVYWHMAHSFVRGTWRNTEVAAPMLLAKCCHDLDILGWILGEKAEWVSSSGTLTHFRPENAPAGAPQRCTDGCPVADTCKFYAPRLYANDKHGWPFDVVTPKATAADRLRALETGPYGRCVYHCDNDVVDHQTVNMQLESGATLTMVMNGHGDEECRTMRYDGTLATLRGKFDYSENSLTITDHLTGETETVDLNVGDSSGHGGGDTGIMRSFINSLHGQPDVNVTSARQSLESHLLAFAAEEARLQHRTVNMPAFRETANRLD